MRPNDSVAIWELGAAATLSDGDLNVVHWINCSVASNLTLPTAVEGAWIEMFNYGTQTITVKNPATTTIGTLATNQGVRLRSWPNASGVPSWTLAITEEGTYLAFTSAPA